jgi:hypothetical protein
MTNINAEEIKLIKSPIPPLNVGEEVVKLILSIKERAKELEREGEAEGEHAKA